MYAGVWRYYLRGGFTATTAEYLQEPYRRVSQYVQYHSSFKLLDMGNKKVGLNS